MDYPKQDVIANLVSYNANDGRSKYFQKSALYYMKC